jgi:hypothetical protein
MQVGHLGFRPGPVSPLGIEGGVGGWRKTVPGSLEVGESISEISLSTLHPAIKETS